MRIYTNSLHISMSSFSFFVFSRGFSHGSSLVYFTPVLFFFCPPSMRIFSWTYSSWYLRYCEFDASDTVRGWNERWPAQFVWIMFDVPSLRDAVFTDYEGSATRFFFYLSLPIFSIFSSAILPARVHPFHFLCFTIFNVLRVNRMRSHPPTSLSFQNLPHGCC